MPCDICGSKVRDSTSQSHIKTKRHQAALQAIGDTVGATPVVRRAKAQVAKKDKSQELVNSIPCPICSAMVKNPNNANHIRSKRHQNALGNKIPASDVFEFAPVKVSKKGAKEVFNFGDNDESDEEKELKTTSEFIYDEYEEEEEEKEYGPMDCTPGSWEAENKNVTTIVYFAGKLQKFYNDKVRDIVKNNATWTSELNKWRRNNPKKPLIGRTVINMLKRVRKVNAEDDDDEIYKKIQKLEGDIYPTTGVLHKETLGDYPELREIIGKKWFISKDCADEYFDALKKSLKESVLREIEENESELKRIRRLQKEIVTSGINKVTIEWDPTISSSEELLESIHDEIKSANDERHIEILTPRDDYVNMPVDKINELIRQAKNVIGDMSIIKFEDGVAYYRSFIYLNDIITDNKKIYQLREYLHGRNSEVNQMSTSDMQIITQLKDHYQIYFVLFKVEGRLSKGGRFWSYLNKTPLNLERLQIYKQLPDKYDDVCFVSSIKELGYKDEEKIDELRVTIIRSRITNNMLKKIASILGIFLVIYSENGNVTGRKYNKKDVIKKLWKRNNYGKEGLPQYEMVQVEDHFMPMLEFPDINKWYCKQYDDWEKYTPKHTYNKKTKNVIIGEDTKATTKDIMLFMIYGKNVKELIKINDADSKFSYLNDDKFFNDLYVKDNWCKEVLNRGEEMYVKKFIKFEAQIKNEKDEIKRGQIEDKKEHWLRTQTYVNNRGNKAAYPEGLINKDKKFYNDDKFNTTTEEKMEFLGRRGKTFRYRQVKMETYDGIKCKMMDYEFWNYHNPYKAKYNIIYLDIESCFQSKTSVTDDGEIIKEDKHVPYCVCYVSDDGKTVKRFVGFDCIEKFLQSLREPTMIYCHNLKYEYNFFMQYVENANVQNKSKLIEGGGQVYSLSTFYVNRQAKWITKLFFKDSYKLIPEGLAKFGDMFGLQQKKELCAYEYYRYEKMSKCEDINQDLGKLEDMLEFIKEDERKDFIEQCKPYMKNEKEVLYVKSAVDYCVRDCEVTRQGVHKFREWMYEVTMEDVHDHLTLPSIAHRYLIEKGCYEGCYNLSSIPRHFIQKCVVGGRTMCEENKMVIVGDKKYLDSIKEETPLHSLGNTNFYETDEINDFDAVSLYPSAMRRIPGFLKGKPKILLPNQLNMNFLKTCDGYFVKIYIHSTGINRKMPAMSVVNQDGVRNFDNLRKQSIYVDKFTLEDLVIHHDIKFDIIKGYYFMDGRNAKVNTIIDILFQERLKFKREGNNIEKVYKLIMNSSYGKTIQKAHEDEVFIVNNENLRETMLYYYYDIKEIIEIVNGKCSIMKMFKSINDHYSLPHVGSEILAVSKSIMHEVVYTAEDNNIPIYYTDTDSMHLSNYHIPILQQKFKEKYGRELIGKGMGQFHTDLESKKGKVICATKSIFLSKKVYIDELKLDNGVEDYHIRMKGISKDCILIKSKNKPMDVYEKLYKGEIVEFDLAANKARFEFQKGYGVIMKRQFLRQVQIRNAREELEI